MNGYDFAAFMRVTIGLGASTTAVPPSAAADAPAVRPALQPSPRPLPGTVRWRGTAEGLRRPRDRYGPDQLGGDQQLADREAPHARRCEAEDARAAEFERSVAEPLEAPETGQFRVDLFGAGRAVDRIAPRTVDRTV